MKIGTSELILAAVINRRAREMRNAESSGMSSEQRAALDKQKPFDVFLEEAMQETKLTAQFIFGSEDQ